MSARIRALSVALAVLTLALFISAIWFDEHTVKLIWTGIVVLFAAISVAALGTPTKK
jgi:hypothetical protein